MGMDFVYIDMEIEETFEIRFEHEDWMAIANDGDVRVGDLFSRIIHNIELLKISRQDIGQIQSFWTEMRTSLQSVTGTELEQIRLTTSLEELFPERTRVQEWKTLQSETPYEVPELRYPGFVAPLGVLLTIASFVFQQIQLWQVPALLNVFPLLAALGALMLVETWFRTLRILHCFRTRFPAGMETVKDLCKRVQRLNYKQLLEQSSKDSTPTKPVSIDTAHEQWQKLVKILAEVLLIKPELITPDSLLMKDFRAS